MRQKTDHPASHTNDGVDRPEHPTPSAPLARTIGRTRYVVLAAVAAVLLVAMALFILGAVLAVLRVWDASLGLLHGELGGSTDLTVQFLEVVSVLLKAVVFYIIGIGLYSLFIAPLNLTTALGVETLNDLETKIVSVVVVIMAVTFLEHFIRWEQPTDTAFFGGTLAVVIVALVVFQTYTHRAKEDQQRHSPDAQMRAKRELFHEDREEREIQPDEVSGVGRGAN